jgi:hypothetical protein
MSVGSGLASATVKLAAGLLPRNLRDRYREQWLADLRDASEGGVPASQIAVGSLAFVLTAKRPLFPGLLTPTRDVVLRRSRLAVALALTTALLSVSQYANFALSSYSLTGNGVYDYVFNLAWALLGLYAVLAIILAAVIVTATRRTAPRVRIGVWILVLASSAAVVQPVIARQFYVNLSPYFGPGSTAYLVGLILVVVAVVIVWPAFRNSAHGSPADPRSRRLLASGLGGLVVAAAVALGIASAEILWAARIPLVFGDSANPVFYAEWLAQKAYGEQLVSSVFTVWIIAGAVAACLVAAGGFARHLNARRSIALTIASLCIVVIVNAGVLDFLQLMESSVVSEVPGEVMNLAGRWGLVAIVLYAIGGVRFEGRASTRMRHRHDVEGSVELVEG